MARVEKKGVNDAKVREFIESEIGKFLDEDADYVQAAIGVLTETSSAVVVKEKTSQVLKALGVIRNSDYFLTLCICILHKLANSRQSKRHKKLFLEALYIVMNKYLDDEEND